MTQRFHIKTYGCQMNVYDSDAMAQILINEGWQAESAPEKAELIILNSCHIRNKAAEKIYSEIGRLQKIKKDKSFIAVAGCVAQAEGKAMIERQKAINFVFGPQHFHELPSMINRAKSGEKTIATDFLTKEKFKELRNLNPPKNKVSAILTIQEGCDKFCSFCVVPYTRGAEVSRTPKDIIAEAKKLVAHGAREIVLLGQNVNAYHHQGTRLASLLAALASIEGLKRLRYTTSHPRDMDESLILAHRDNPKLMPHLHLPVQSGSDRVLEKMNRRHTAKDYYDIISSLKMARPDLAISSDFIVGFPQESEQDFLETMTLVKDITFSQAYSFKYSPRAGTKAAEQEQIDENIKSDRLTQLQKLLSLQQTAFHKSKEGQVLEVLVEKNNYGKTPYGQSTHFSGGDDRCIGEIVKVEISRATPFGLKGKIL